MSSTHRRMELLHLGSTGRLHHQLQWGSRSTLRSHLERSCLQQQHSVIGWRETTGSDMCEDWNRSSYSLITYIHFRTWSVLWRWLASRAGLPHLLQRGTETRSHHITSSSGAQDATKPPALTKWRQHCHSEPHTKEHKEQSAWAEVVYISLSCEWYSELFSNLHLVIREKGLTAGLMKWC